MLINLVFFMQISWLGHAAFRLQGKTTSDVISIVTDPYKSEKVGLKMPHVEADIVTISHDHDDHNGLEAIKGEPFVIRGAGEYEVKGVYIEGIESYHDDEKGAKRGNNIIYRFELEDISIAHLGDLGHELTDKQLERLEGTDIVLIPVGGVYTIDAQKAVSVINQIEPRIVIPMHYSLPGLKFDLGTVDQFLKAIAVKPRKEEKLKITKKDLPQEDMEVVILEF